MLALLFVFACAPAPVGETSPPAPEPPKEEVPAPDPMVAHMEKMAKIRDALRAELGEAYDAPVAGLDKADAAKGQVLYDQHCKACHGTAGLGDGPAAAGLTTPPANLTDPFHSRYYSDAGRLLVIRKGLPDVGMPGFGDQIPEPDLLDLYVFVRGLRAVSIEDAHDAQGHAH